MNNAELIPAMLCADEAEFRHRAEILTGLVSTIQVDVMDNTFVKNVSWADPQVIAQMQLPYKKEVHLMIDNPEKTVAMWILAGADRIFVHAEAAGDPRGAVRVVKTMKCEAGLAINPDTPVSAIADILPELDAVLVMGVTPGWSGQAFQPVALEKVRELKQLRPELRVEVDGGVTPDIARQLVAVGCDGVMAASALFKAPDLKKAVAEFEAALVRG